MRVLLDTHAFFWAVRDPDRLSGAAREVLSDAAVELVVSAIVPWELATKARIGKWPEAEHILLSLDQALGRLGATSLPFDHHHGAAAGSLPWDHRDPFDRALAAQSILERLPLVTSDSAFGSLPGLRVLW